MDPVTAAWAVTTQLRTHGLSGWRVERFWMDASGRIHGPLAKVGQHGCATIGFHPR